MNRSHRKTESLYRTRLARAKSGVDVLTKGSHMTIDDDTLKQLLRINDELFQVCKWLNEKRDLEVSSRAHTSRGRPHACLVSSG
jgi:hypothetical protein